MPTTEKVSFVSRGIKVAGELYVPDDATVQKRAAVVVAHPMTGVKEQTASRYAAAIAEAGFYALAYDAAYQGESEGEPRFLEDPYQRAWDNSAAVDYLVTRNEVDAERIGILGICGSGGYVSFAAQTDTRMKAVAILSAADIGSLYRDGMPVGTTTREELKEQLKGVAEMRNAEARGEKAATNDFLPTNWEDLPASITWREGGEYYLTARGGHPRSCNKVVTRSLGLLANYDSFRYNDMIAPRAYLAVVGEKSSMRYFSEEAVKAAEEPKELYVVPGATHVKLYDDIEVAAKKLVEFYTKHLGK